MHIQQSYTETDKGKLYVVPTPIGNLEDMTYRAVRILREVPLIAAEDTRHTKKLLNHFGIQTPLISYHEHNKMSRHDMLIEHLNSGKSLAVVSDAGMPGISDPGADLVGVAVQEEVNVVVLPGASAAITALVGSGLSTEEFLFYGFLPRKKKERKDVFERLKLAQSTVILYESPYRLLQTVEDIEAFFGERELVLTRELTKKYEEYIRGTTKEIKVWLKERKILGECCILVEGEVEDKVEQDDLWWRILSIVEHVDYYVENEDLHSKEAIKKVAKERELKKQDVYRKYHV